MSFVAGLFSKEKEMHSLRFSSLKTLIGKHKLKSTIISINLLLLLPVFAAALEPENLDTAKRTAILYHDSGEYEYDQESVIQQAQSYLALVATQKEESETKSKPAIVLDIDETSLSNYQHMLQMNFGMIPNLVNADIRKADDPPISATLQLYRQAKKLGVAVFFITGRPEKLREITEKNLLSAGFKDWDGLYLKPNDYSKPSVIPYKSASRESIEARGYRIIINVGDQYSDLAGGHSVRVFKLPNPYYYIP